MTSVTFTLIDVENRYLDPVLTRDISHKAIGESEQGTTLGSHRQIDRDR